jgi:hypothetical protein
MVCWCYAPGRKRYTYSDEDEDDDEDEEVMTKRSKRTSSNSAPQSNKRASDVDLPVSRTRTRASDGGAVTPTTRNRAPQQKDGSQSAESGTRSRRSDTSSKENRFFDDDVKQVVALHYAYVFVFPVVKDCTFREKQEGQKLMPMQNSNQLF